MSGLTSYNSSWQFRSNGPQHYYVRAEAICVAISDLPQFVQVAKSLEQTSS